MLTITYILLSPTFGMHQYTADLAGRMASASGELWTLALERDADASPRAGKASDSAADGQPVVHLVTTSTCPRDRYPQRIQIHTPVTTHGTGFSREGLNIAGYRRIHSTVCNIYPGPHEPDRKSAVYHFTGVHAWNIPLAYTLHRRKAAVIHTLHDLDPHHGVRYPALIRAWNRLIIASGCHLLVHGRRYRDQLIAQGVPAERITCTPLLHGFLSAAHDWPPGKKGECKAERKVSVLFFGRVEAYKGADTLLEAWRRMVQADGVRYDHDARLIIAGPVAQGVMLPSLPPGVELRDRRIMDDEAEALFRGADLLVLPYRDATQSALVAAAYAYGIPVIVTATGALPEYVAAGETGWIVPPGNAEALATALQDALSDEQRRQTLGAAGRAWFATQRKDEEATLANMYQRLL